MTPRSWEVFVSTAPGLEGITAGEVEALGFTSAVREPGGLALEASDEGLLRLNLHLRTASRVLVRLATFRASGFGELERKAKDIHWERVLSTAPGTGDDAPTFDVTSRKSRLYHTGAVAERLQRSLHAWGEGRPRFHVGPDRSPPRFVVRLLRDRLVLSADASGEHLHRRGYRQAVAKAPLRETVAAALLLAAEWDGRTPLFDPFCGSGTLVIEAALMASSIPPGQRRRFACQDWPGFDPGEAPVPGVGRPPDAGADPASAEAMSTTALPPMVGSDRDVGALRAADANARRAGVAPTVSWIVAPLSRAPFPTLQKRDDAGPRGLLVTNPPWGRRVGDTRRLQNLYGKLGTLLRERWAGGRAVLLCPDQALVGQLGFETRTLFRTRLGGIPVEALALDVPREVGPDAG